MAEQKSTFSQVHLHCRPMEKGIFHAFPVDVNKKQDTAISWASGRYGTTFTPKLFKYDNVKGFDTVHITELEHRGEGGRAYQVVITEGKNKFQVDLREDALMDIILNAGIQKGGQLNGTYRFIQNKAQVNLVRIGSKAETTFTKEINNINNAETVKMSELVVGQVYSCGPNSKRKAIYVGKTFAPKAYLNSWGRYGSVADFKNETAKQPIESFHVFLEAYESDFKKLVTGKDSGSLVLTKSQKLFKLEVEELVGPQEFLEGIIKKHHIGRGSIFGRGMFLANKEKMKELYDIAWDNIRGEESTGGFSWDRRILIKDDEKTNERMKAAQLQYGVIIK